MKVEGACFIDISSGSGSDSGIYSEDAAGSSREIFNIASQLVNVDHVHFFIHRVEVLKMTKLALRGIHNATFSRVVSCVMGKVFAVVVDLRPESQSFMEWDGSWLTTEETSQNPSAISLLVPPRCGLATFSPQEALVLLHHGGADTDTLPSSSTSSPFPRSPPPSHLPRGLLWNDPSVNISWPLAPHQQPLLAAGDESLPLLLEIQSSLTLPDFSCDVLLYGSTGYFGSFLLRLLRSSGVDVCCSCTRLEDRAGLFQDSVTFRPKRVMNCAGVTGKPNIMWCESHKPETARANFTGLLNLLDVFAPLDVHVTTIGTGIIHCYDKEHRLDNDVGYTEDDPPSYDGNVYVRLRVAQEKMVEEVFPGKCLTLRVQYPISSDMHPNCCLSKLLQYPKIFGLSTSMTVLDDLFPQINQLSLNRVTGPLNFTNPGRMDNVSLLNKYKEIVDGNISFKCGSPEEMIQFLTIPRPFSLLDSTRLLAVCPDVLPLEVALMKVLLQIAENNSKSADTS